jgi:hypothetical protein
LLFFSITNLLVFQQGVIHAQVHCRDRYLGDRSDRALLTQFLFHHNGIQQAARIEQRCQRRLHSGFTLACSQVQDSQVLLGSPGWLPLDQQVVGHAETAAGEQIGPVAIVLEGPGLADQPVDDVPIVDLVLAPASPPGQSLYEFPRVENLDPLGIQAGFDPGTDQPAGHRVNIPLHPDSAAGLHAHPQLLACLQASRRQGPQQSHFFRQTGLTPSIELGE